MTLTLAPFAWARLRALAGHVSGRAPDPDTMLLLAGAAAVTEGVREYSSPMAWIVAGLYAIGLAFFVGGEG